MAMYCNNFEFNESRDDFLLNAEPPEAFAMYPNSNPGPPGPPGPGLAPGGTTGQVLVKASDEDFDTEWSSLYNKADVIVDSVGPAAIASFPDGASDMPIREITATIVPQQDLHGYDAPWPPGGGKNKYNPATDTTGYNIKADGTFTPGQDAFYSDLIPVVQGPITWSGLSNSQWMHRLHGYDANGDWVQELANAQSQSGVDKPYEINATVPSGVAYVRISGKTTDKDIQVELSASKTPYAPYSNECPITGWTGANVTAAGANLFNSNDSEMVGGYYIDAAGAIQSNQYMKYCATYIKVNPSESYAIGCKKLNTNDGSISVAYYDKNKAFISRDLVVSPTTSQTTISGTFTTPATAAFIRFNSPAQSNETQIVKGTAILNPYKSYTGESIAISWQDEAGTVYYGTLVIREDGSVILTSTHAKIKLSDLSSWDYQSQYTRFRGQTISIPSGYTARTCPFLSSCYLPVSDGRSLSNVPDKAAYFGNSTDNAFFVKDSAYTDPDVFIAAMGDQTIVYPIATPLTYTFDNIGQLFTELGTNNVWIDTGDTSVTYPCDTKLYIGKKLAAVVAALS